MLSLIEDEPDLAAYQPYCVLEEIQSRFATPLEFAEAAKADSPEITSVAVDVVSEC